MLFGRLVRCRGSDWWRLVAIVKILSTRVQLFMWYMNELLYWINPNIIKSNCFFLSFFLSLGLTSILNVAKAWVSVGSWLPLQLLGKNQWVFTWRGDELRYYIRPLKETFRERKGVKQTCLVRSNALSWWSGNIAWFGKKPPAGVSPPAPLMGRQGFASLYVTTINRDSFLTSIPGPALRSVIQNYDCWSFFFPLVFQSVTAGSIWVVGLYLSSWFTVW